MKRPWKILLGLVGTVLVLAVVAVIVAKAVFTRERILAMLSPRVEQMVRRPVRIGDAGVSFWGGIGIRLGDITIGNRPGFSPEPMLTLRSVDVKARFWPLLAGKVVIDHVQVEQPSLLWEYDAQGRSNVEDLVTPSERTSPSGTGAASDTLTAAVLLQRLIVADGRFALRDRRVGRMLDVSGLRLDLTAAARSDRQAYTFALHVTFDTLAYSRDGRFWPTETDNPRLYFAGAWEPQTKEIRFDSLTIDWREARLAAEGMLSTDPSMREVQISARLSPSPVHRFIPEIRHIWPRAPVAGLSATAQGTVEARFTLPLLPGAAPEWRANLDLTDVRWAPSAGTAAMTIPRIELRGGEQTCSWSLSGGRYGDGTFSTSGTVDQLFLPNRTVTVRVQADMPVEGLQQLLSDSARWQLSGRINAELTGFGTFNDWQRSNLNGRIVCENIVAADPSWTFGSVAVSAECQVDGQDVALSRCDWRAGASAGSVTGKIQRLLPAALARFRSPDVPRAALAVDCMRLDLDQLIGPPTAVADTGVATAVPVPLPPLIATGDLTCDTLIYSGLTLSRARSGFSLMNNVLTLSPIEADVLGGRMDGSLTWNLGTWPHPTFNTSLRADSIEANDLLSRYLGWAGGIFGRTSFTGEFSGQGRYAPEIMPTLTATGRLDLRSGRLEAAPLLARVGTQLGVAGLDRPREIRDLALPFRIADGRLLTDNLRFSSEDAQYTVSGSMGFDGTLDYQVKIVAGDPRRLPRGLSGVGLRFQLGGTVTAPEVRLNAGETGKALIKGLMESARDTVKTSVDNILKNLLPPRKP